MTLMKRKIQCPVFLALVLLVLGLAPVALAQPADPGNRPDFAGPPQDVVDQLLDRGFQQIQPSIFEREVDAEPFSYETVVYGVDGHEWLLGQQQAFLETLQARYELFPAVELMDAILAQEHRIAETEALIAEMRAAEADNTSGASQSEGTRSVRLGAEELISAVEAATCTTTLSRSGTAGPGSTGPTASGGSSFSDNCSESGTVSALATAQGTDSTGNIVTYSDECPSRTGSSVSCSASASVNAVTSCFSSGQGSVTFGFFTYTVSRSNNTCRLLTASLTGTTYIYVPAYSTGFGSWSVSASGGTTPYNYQWFFNNGPVGTNSTSYSRSFPHPGYGTTVYYTVKVTVTDSSSPSQTATRSLSVRVVYASPSTCDPCYQICPIAVVPGAATVGGTDSVTEQPCVLP
jgi:hypothetical protein